MNLESYFDTKDFYETNYLIKIMEGMGQTDFTEIKSKVDHAQITLTEEEIKKYLDDKFSEEEPEVKDRLGKNVPVKPSGKITYDRENIQEIRKSIQETTDKLIAARYMFTPYTLEYYQRYLKILKYKIKKLLFIIENLANKNYQAIKEEMESLDIIIYKGDKICKYDIIRLIKPTLYNMQKLEEKLAKGNDLNTYLEGKITKPEIYKNGYSEEQLYPSPSLKVTSLTQSGTSGYVDLSPRQLKIEREKMDKNIQNVAKLLLS